MNLDHWFTRMPKTHIDAIAAKAGTSANYLRACKYRQRHMSADLAIRLEWASAGELTARELRPDLPWPDHPGAYQEDSPS
jgi:DNA-binding transcriptional regulator YdaS (Cro superfamily)